MFEQRWQAAWEAVGARPGAGLLEALLGRYAEAGRAYHTQQHLLECLGWLDAAAHLAERVAEVELGLWFHDAIYDTQAQDNEDQSARWAASALASGGASGEVVDRVVALIGFTKHDAVPPGGDAALLVDVDLSILGADEARFAEYEAQVRVEYGWVPEEAYRLGRARVLSSFLERPHVYGTPWFRERLEARARANLERSLRRGT